MRLYNTLTHKIEDFKPLDDKKVSIYSCGPTVYDHIHIGNLSSFIYADTLRRVLQSAGYEVQHVMNFTDVDDKTIRRSQEKYSEDSPEVAIEKLTSEFKQIFLDDMRSSGNDTGSIRFVSAVDSIPDMQKLITELHGNGFAYIADDGIYFSIEKYRKSGRKYGQLLTLSTENTSNARINNDEYDKDSVHDFALWKLQKDNEPVWPFELDGHQLAGRPGWHIECSAMSTKQLGQPFDIHTGGVDLIFPHHENEIAQSTAGHEKPNYAQFFVHNEHILVDGKKMSKSLNNFYTLTDIRERGFDPMAFRLMVLQSHYRNQSNFTWEVLQAAQTRLKKYRAMADLLWQIPESPTSETDAFLSEAILNIRTALDNDMNTPQALAIISKVEGQWLRLLTCGKQDLRSFLEFVDSVIGLNLMSTRDLDDDHYNILNLLEERLRAKQETDWTKSDDLRSRLADEGIGLRDTAQGQVWHRL